VSDENIRELPREVLYDRLKLQYEYVSILVQTIDCEPADSAEAADARDRLRNLALEAAGQLSEVWRKQYEAGGKQTLMLTLEMFLQCDFIPPPWVREVVHSATLRCPKSWDKAFGKPPKGRVAEVSTAIKEGMRLHAEGYKKEDSGLFPELAKRMNNALGTDISAGTAKNRYYAISKGTKYPAPLPLPLWPFNMSPDDLTLDATAQARLCLVLSYFAFLSKTLGIKLEEKK